MIKSRLISILVCVAVVASNGEEPRRNVRVGSVHPNDTGIVVGSRIHGGDFAPEGKFTYMVFLLGYNSVNDRSPGSSCSASLIDPKWVLTAAHCVTPAMIAVAGKANLVDYWRGGRLSAPFDQEIDEEKFGVQERKIRRTYVHPGYSSATNEWDVALLLLDKPFDLESNKVAVIPLASSRIGKRMPCTSVGWGLQDNSLVQTFRLMFASPVLASFSNSCYYIRTGSFICLEMGGPGICRGDSGSPLVCQDKVWGVASFSVSAPGNSDCTLNSEEYYSSLYENLNWIEMTIKNGAPQRKIAPIIFLLLFHSIFQLNI